MVEVEVARRISEKVEVTLRQNEDFVDAFMSTVRVITAEHTLPGNVPQDAICSRCFQPLGRQSGDCHPIYTLKQ